MRNPCRRVEWHPVPGEEVWYEWGLTMHRGTFEGCQGTTHVVKAGRGHILRGDLLCLTRSDLHPLSAFPETREGAVVYDHQTADA